ncbi:MAG: DUF192 domain-containing protein [Planctomycetota bacterium]
MTGSLAAITPVAIVACALAQGCSRPAAPAGFERVQINDRSFTLEVVADDASRTLGLGGRTAIPADGGMLFSFPDSQIRQFVMRDCLVDIDIIFLDAAGVITAMHHMPVEPPIQPDETRNTLDALGRVVRLGSYEQRLKRYSSRFNARYAIELQGGMLENLDLQPGQRIELPTERLAEITR